MKKNPTIWRLGVLICLMSFFLITPAMADDTKPWKDEAELSFVMTDGNAEILTLAAKNLFSYTFTEKWAGSWEAGALYGKVDDTRVAERYYTDLRVDYTFSEQLYFYGLGGWYKNEFAGIDQRYYLGPGAGYHILNGERHILFAEAGLAYAFENYTDDTDANFLEGRLFGKYTFVLNPKTKFSQSLEYLINFNDVEKFHIKSVTSAITSITDSISVKLTYEIYHANDPIPDTLDKTDSILTVALVVNF